MKLERNRAERRSKRGVPIIYKGIPYLIFAALAAGFLLGAPQMVAASSIAQADKSTVTIVERKQFPFAFAGYLGKTNSVLSRGFTEKDFTYTGSKAWVDEGDGNWRLMFLSSGTFTPKKKITVDIFLCGGGSGGGNSNGGNARAGGGGAGGRTGTVFSKTLNAHQAYAVVVGAGGANHGAGGNTIFNDVGGVYYAVAGGNAIVEATHYNGASGGSGGAGSPQGNGGSNGGNGASGSFTGGTGQGANTYLFGNAALVLYAGGGGSGGGQYSYNWTPGMGGAGGGANGGNGWSNLSNGQSAAANTGGGGGGAGVKSGQGASGGWGGSGICVIRNTR